MLPQRGGSIDKMFAVDCYGGQFTEVYVQYTADAIAQPFRSVTYSFTRSGKLTH